MTMKHWWIKSYRANWSTCTNTCPSGSGSASATCYTNSPTWTWLNMAFCHFGPSLAMVILGGHRGLHGFRMSLNMETGMGLWDTKIFCCWNNSNYDNICYSDFINLYSNLKRRKSKNVGTPCHLWASMFVPFKHLNQLILMKSWYHSHGTGRALTPPNPNPKFIIP